MKNHRIKPNSGETMVEVMASIVIFLLMMAILQGAISFSSNAQAKSRQIRETNAEICQKLQETPYSSSGGGKVKYSFKATSADGSITGVSELFSVEVELGRKDVSYTDGTESKQTTFYLFGTDAGAGGGTRSEERRVGKECM